MTEKTFCGYFATLLLAAVLCAAGSHEARGQNAEPGEQSEIAALKAEVEALKGMLPSQSHTMIDVEYHFANLWFAAKNGNWPLATFYLNETRGHLNWAVRVRPVRPLADGKQIDLRPILKGIEESTLADLRMTVEKQDATAFETAYRRMLDACYACHQAAQKPFLRPQLPERPASVIIDNAD